MTIEECFAKNLKRFRQENGLTQSELAEVSGISFKHIYKLETAYKTPEGGSNLSIRYIDILSKSLGVSVISFFLDEEGNKYILIKNTNAIHKFH